MSSETKKKAIAARLVLARKQSGLSQAQLARLMKLHRPSISEMEAGRRNVSVEELTALAKLYSVSVSWLACEDSDKPDVNRDKLELAARKLAGLKKQDLDKILDLLRAMQTEGGSK
jgi:transcriptional regulator with XRE-family HTH domain